MNLLIKNGLVIDPALGLNHIKDIAIIGGRFAEPSEAVTYKHIIDASGCIVTPGLIDFHLHLFDKGTDVGVNGDTSGLPNGVTSAVDAGSAGVSNIEAFISQVVKQSKLTVKAYLNVCPAGLATSMYHETISAELIKNQYGRMEELLDKHKGVLLGLKLRFSKEVVGDTGMATLEATINAADKLGCSVVVHTTNPPATAADILSVLRAGDIYCHMFQGRGNTILDGQGHVDDALYQARARGVVFDAASGKNHYCNRIAQAAIEQGFLPDIISTDLTANTVYQHPVYSLPFMMSKHLNMGMNLPDIIKATTSTPARLMGIAQERGSLAPGKLADLAIFKLKERRTDFYDFRDDSFTGDKLLMPQMTVKEGEIVFRQLDFI